MIKVSKIHEDETILFFEKIEHFTSFTKESLKEILEREGKDSLLYYIMNTMGDYVLDLIEHELKLIDSEIIEQIKN